MKSYPLLNPYCSLLARILAWSGKLLRWIFHDELWKLAEVKFGLTRNDGPQGHRWNYIKQVVVVPQLFVWISDRSEQENLFVYIFLDVVFYFNFQTRPRKLYSTQYNEMHWIQRISMGNWKYDLHKCSYQWSVQHNYYFENIKLLLFIHFLCYAALSMFECFIRQMI